jgi:hypothetical protein
MDSKSIVRKGVRVRIPHPAPLSDATARLRFVGHVRSQEVVDSAMDAWRHGVHDAENAERHGVTIQTIRRWRREYVRRGKPRGQLHVVALCPRCDDVPLHGAAYAELLGWYLGDGNISRQRRGVFGLHITNDLRYSEINQHIAELMLLVKPASRPHTREGTGCMITTVSWKHWPCLFPQHGPGRKHTRQLGMADWQWDIVEQHPADFLRGLFHSDGCRVNNWALQVVAGEKKRYEYPRWQFTNESAEIMAWCQEALDLLDIPWRQSSRRLLSVSRRDAVARLDELIGFKR